MLTPFILGIVIQVSAMIGADVAAPVDDHKIDTKISRDEFAYRLDVAVFMPAFFTLLSAALLNRGRLSETAVTFTVMGSVLAFVGLAFALYKWADPTSYRLSTRRFFGATPLSVGIIVTNVVLGLITLAIASPEQEQEPNRDGPPATHAAASSDRSHFESRDFAARWKAFAG
ncbi:hypothetical protein [Nocardioides acrostichi]|uniref:Uncharacterized protein n=1 Tax=Nocardioides acrostichi TaxID=2784339 RepID=A0A930YEN6_9ACTN|nr:hypothetical protein [Nocardioides acrostichi]MBF4163659.1 hypothetical protein [Nocardioides acrostichi]